MHKNTNTGLFGDIPVGLPKTERVTLTEALTWLAFGDSFTDERFAENGQKPESAYWEADNGNYPEDSMGTVLSLLCDQARDSKIELHGFEVINGCKQGRREKIPPDVFETPLKWWPTFYGENGFHENGPPWRKYEDVYLLRCSVLALEL